VELRYHTMNIDVYRCSIAILVIAIQDICEKGIIILECPENIVDSPISLVLMCMYNLIVYR
jgi:hypothetical protein